MSRSIIGGIVAIVIAALTATAYFVTTSSLEGKLRTEAQARVQRALGLLQRDTQLVGLDVQNKAEFLATDPSLLTAVKADNGGDRIRESNRAFQRFKAKAGPGNPVPDILALVDASGDVAAMDGVPNPVANAWKKKGERASEMVWPGVELALKRRIIISEVWNYPGKGLMRVGIAPIIDPEAQVPAGDEDGVIIIGAAVAAYALTSAEAMRQKALLGADVAYYDGNDVFATSFRRGSEEDTSMQTALTHALTTAGLNQPGTGTKTVRLNGVPYYATSGRIARFASKDLPTNYPPVSTGAIVLSSPENAAGALGTVKALILILGGGSLAIALFGLYLSNRRLLHQIDDIELGVAEIINGNLDRTFRPVGEETEGLSNGLNVMLARLLGRPEPGEEEFDENGNPIVPGRVEFEEAEEGGKAPAPDPELAALAQEPEPDYYKRIYTDYLDARRRTGNPDEVSFENFIAKLKVNEGKLKAQYNCSRVRFRVVVKDGKVSLKPVPIFA